MLDRRDVGGARQGGQGLKETDRDVPTVASK
jgi:hypothetical protein